jgi:hypothetical protein
MAVPMSHIKLLIAGQNIPIFQTTYVIRSALAKDAKQNKIRSLRIIGEIGIIKVPITAGKCGTAFGARRENLN